MSIFRITRTLALIAGTITLIGGCAKEISEEEPVVVPDQAEGFVTVSSSVSFAPNTRALTEDGVKTFAVGEKIAVVYEHYNPDTYSFGTKVALSDALTTDDISENGKSTKFTVTLDHPQAGSVTFVYPPSMVDEEGEEVSLSAQNGTFSGLQAFDYAKGSGDLEVNGTEVTLPLGVALVNQVAVAKITLKDIDGTAELTGIKMATINNGAQGYRISPKSPATTLSWPIYVAMKPMEDVKVTVAATDGTYHYQKSSTGRTFSAGKIYPITAQMEKETGVVDLSFLTANYEAQDGEILVNALTGDYKVSIADGASITLRNATIACLSDRACFAGLTCSGDATINLVGNNYIMAGGGADDWDYYVQSYGYYPGIYVKPNKTMTIQGDGVLDAWTYTEMFEGNLMYGSSAAIGGGSYGADSNCGTIVIKSGTINAYGGGGAAAIGAGSCCLYENQGHYVCDGIRIEGGTIHAVGGEGAAGIGAGYGTICGNIVITGGTIIAEGGEHGAGIGSGYAQEFYSTCGDIEISGANVTAIGGRFAAGIGSGVKHDDSSVAHKNSSCGNILIHGGATVNASTNGDGGVLFGPYFYGAAGIGTGASCSTAPNYCGLITITADVNKVIATKASDATNCLGRNYETGYCAKVTIDGTEYEHGVGPNQTDGNTFIYPDN